MLERLRAGGAATSSGPATSTLRLGPEGLQFFRSDIVAASWYPMSFYGPLRKLLREVEGGGEDKYTVERAAESARKLIASGIYPQLTYLKEWQDHDHVPLPDPEANATVRRKHRERRRIEPPALAAGWTRDAEEAGRVAAENLGALVVVEGAHGALDRGGGVRPGAFVVRVVVGPHEIVHEIVL